jgi:hypothetical protein
MKKTNLVLTVALLLGVSICTAQISIPQKLQKHIQANKIPDGISVPATLLKKDIDLAAFEIKVSVISAVTNHSAKLKIEGIVKNVGRLNYRSASGQQVALLYEEIPGTAPRLVATQSFQNLAVNATTRLSYSKFWDKTANAEFPPNYTLVITFDTDLYTDGNVNNDDAVSANNRLTKNGSEINSMSFR